MYKSSDDLTTRPFEEIESGCGCENKNNQWIIDNKNFLLVAGVFVALILLSKTKKIT